MQKQNSNFELNKSLENLQSAQQSLVNEPRGRGRPRKDQFVKGNISKNMKSFFRAVRRRYREAFKKFKEYNNKFISNNELILSFARHNFDCETNSKLVLFLSGLLENNSITKTSNSQLVSLGLSNEEGKSIKKELKDFDNLTNYYNKTMLQAALRSESLRIILMDCGTKFHQKMDDQDFRTTYDIVLEECNKL